MRLKYVNCIIRTPRAVFALFVIGADGENGRAQIYIMTSVMGFSQTQTHTRAAVGAFLQEPIEPKSSRPPFFSLVSLWMQFDRNHVCEKDSCMCNFRRAPDQAQGRHSGALFLYYWMWLTAGYCGARERCENRADLTFGVMKIEWNSKTQLQNNCGGELLLSREMSARIFSHLREMI